MDESKGKIIGIYGEIKCKVKTQSYVLIFQSIYFLINCDTSLTNLQYLFKKCGIYIDLTRNLGYNNKAYYLKK